MVRLDISREQRSVVQTLSLGKELSGNFQKTSQSQLRSQVARFYNESALRLTEQKKEPVTDRSLSKVPVLYFFLSFWNFTLVFSSFILGVVAKKTHYPLFHQSTLRPTEQDVTDQAPSKVYVLYFFLSFFLELYTGFVSFLLSSRGEWTKKNTTPYFSRARFGQPSRTLRTRLLQRYMCSISFFLSRTLHWFRVFSSFIQGVVDKKKHYPYFTRARFGQPRSTLRTKLLERYKYMYSISFFLSRTLHASRFCSSFIKGWTKQPLPYFTRARLVQPRRTLRTRLLQRYMYTFPSFFLYCT